MISDATIGQIVTAIVAIATLFFNYRQNKTIQSQAETIKTLINELDGLPKRVAELTANAVITSDFVEALQQRLLESGVEKSDQPKSERKQKLTPMTSEADQMVKEAQDKI